jgi:hypothetical protein
VAKGESLAPEVAVLEVTTGGRSLALEVVPKVEEEMVVVAGATSSSAVHEVAASEPTRRRVIRRVRHRREPKWQQPLMPLPQLWGNQRWLRLAGCYPRCRTWSTRRVGMPLRSADASSCG